MKVEDHGRDAHGTRCQWCAAVARTSRPWYEVAVVRGRNGQDVEVEEHGRDLEKEDHGREVEKGEHGRDEEVEEHGRDAHATLRIRQGARLPHWSMDGATYFVTFRLGDALPKSVLDAWLYEREAIEKAAMLRGNPLNAEERKRLNFLYSEKVGKYLDAGHGACWMKDDNVAGIVANSLQYFNGDRYDLFAWCVMPNHIHAVLRPLARHELPKILHSWKSFSAHAANSLLRRDGQFWEVEYYDHLIRDEADFRHCVEYTLANPEMAGLVNWKWVSSTGVPPVNR